MMEEDDQATEPAWTTPALSKNELAGFVRRSHGAPIQQLRLEAQTLRGGIQATSVTRVRARFRDMAGLPHSVAFVVKRLDGELCREAVIYQTLLRQTADLPAPRLMEIVYHGPTTCDLYLEAITPWRRWPWADLRQAGLVLEQLAAVHTLPTGVRSPSQVPTWDYEQAFAGSAESTLHTLERVADHVRLPLLRASRPALRRTVAALPAIRRILADAEPFGICLIHGDMHPGNVLIRGQGIGQRVILLDWANARLGSPLEDVSSWLQWVGYWVPEARRRHDALMRRYLTARDLGRYPSRELRVAYWLAGACNALTGVLRYQLEVLSAGEGRNPGRIAQARSIIEDCLRVVRRADACLRGV